MHRIDPHKICRPTSTDVAEAKSRVRDGIPRLDALTKSANAATAFPGFTEPVPYAHRPLSRYQKAMRTHVVGNRVKYQYTRRFTADVVERVVKVPLRPNAFHDGARNWCIALI
jgi:DNA (cytosine-5)-methyltransferase 1